MRELAYDGDGSYASHHSHHVLLLCLTLDGSESERFDETKRDEVMIVVENGSNSCEND